VPFPRGVSAPASGVSLARLPRPTGADVRAAASAVALTACSSLFVVAGGAWIRVVGAMAVAGLLIAIARSRPGLAIVATLVYLVFLAMLRRLLLPAAPWVSADPMLLVAPLVASTLIVRAFISGQRRWAPDAISKGVLVLLAITLAEVFNPQGGGISAGISGLMFMAVPLLWFFVGREYLDDRAVERIMVVIVALGSVVACYGLWQILVGNPPWDANWLRTPGASQFSSLNVGGKLRAFGTFSGFLEYALFLGVALAVAVTLFLQGKRAAAIPIPLLAVALFLASGRAPLITAVFAIVVVVGLRTGRPVRALVITVVAIGVTIAALHFGGSSLSGASPGSGALVSHQLSGFANPLDPSSSTLLVHLQLVVEGVKSSLSHPYGQGTAVTNGAAGVIRGGATRDNGLGNAPAVGAGSSATDMDISNAFVAFGIVGGAIYLLLVLFIIVQGVRAYFAGNPEVLAVVAILVVGVGQWTNGGNYALASLIWMLAGVVAARAHQLPRGRP
jgi:hypothetical protein